MIFITLKLLLTTSFEIELVVRRVIIGLIELTLNILILLKVLLLQKGVGRKDASYGQRWQDWLRKA